MVYHRMRIMLNLIGMNLLNSSAIPVVLHELIRINIMET